MLEDRLKKVFTSALGLAADVDPTSLAYAQNPVWDSVAHMQLIGALESEFDIMLETDDVIAMSSFQEAVRIVRKYGVA
ncbi:MAG TPA: acyl carrier protein [Polyangiales bacterium]